jgi:hypothetical protein
MWAIKQELVALRSGSANVLRIVTPNPLAWVREWDGLRQALAA